MFVYINLYFKVNVHKTRIKNVGYVNIFYDIYFLPP